MKTRLLSLIMAFVMVFSLVPSAFADETQGEYFADVPKTAWYYDAVTECASRDVVHGVGDNAFAPDKGLTYAEVAMMVCNIFGVDTTVTDGGMWYEKAIQYCANHLYVADGVDPNAIVTREAAADFLYRAFSYCFEGGQNNAVIPDSDSVNTKYLNSVKQMYANGIIAGVNDSGDFMPTKQFTRAEFCTVLARTFPHKGEYDMSHMSYAQLALIVASSNGLTADELSSGDKWYTKAIEYCVENKIIPEDVAPLSTVDNDKAVAVIKSAVSGSPNQHEVAETYAEVTKALNVTSSVLSKSDVYSLVDVAVTNTTVAPEAGTTGKVIADTVADTPVSNETSSNGETANPDNQNSSQNTQNNDQSGTTTSGGTVAPSNSTTSPNGDTSTGNSNSATSSTTPTGRGSGSRTAIPTVAGEFVYDGNSHSPVIAGCNEALLTITGDTFAIEAGEYSITFTPKDNASWLDYTNAPKTFVWTIVRNTEELVTPSFIANSLVYNGNAQAPIAACWRDYDANKLTMSVNEQTDAGTYTASFTPKENCEWEDGTTDAREVSWSIAPLGVAKPTTDDDKLTFTYDGQPHELTAACFDTFESEYYILTTPSGAQAGVANSYSSVVTLKDTTNYCWSDTGDTAPYVVTWGIGVAPASLTNTPTAVANLTYSGSAQTLITEGSTSDGTLKYKLEGGEYDTALPTATDAGTYTIWYKVFGDSNHRDSTERSLTVTIAPMEQTYVAPTLAASVEYDGNTHALLATAGSADHGTIEYSVNGGAWSTTEPTAATIGDYEVSYRITGNHNYANVNATVIGTFTIAKNLVTVPTITSSAFTYDGSEHTVTIANEPDASIATRSGDVSATNAGEYTITYTLVDPDNYQWADGFDGSITWSISKATPSVTAAPTANALTYDGTAQALVTEGTVSGGELQYKLDDGAYSTTVPTATNAGTYTVAYKVVGDSNYNDVGEESIVVVIAQKPVTITANTQPLVYGATISQNTSDVTVDALALGDTLTAITLTASTNSTSGGTITPSNAVIERNGVNVTDNYNISYTNGAWTTALKFIAHDNKEFTLKIDNSSKGWDGTIEWSTNSTDWTEWDGTTTLNSENGVLYLRGENNSKIIGYNEHSKFVLGGESTRVACEGNIEALRSYTGTAPDMAGYCYSYMFWDCTSLTTAPALPATTLASHCYTSMFEGCTALTTAPALPATTLASYCYESMFEGCTALTTAPALPATTLASYCYANMFESCTALTTAPALPATTLADRCYGRMFEGCTSLTTAPALPATTLATYCYISMFSDCTSLTAAPALPATTLATDCYSGMFFGCTSLTTAPALPATTLMDSCYLSMFFGCTSLTTAPALPATTLATSCYSGMFSGCTSLTTASALPATTLAANCYSSMFSDCTSLTTAPALPATTLAEGCYRRMFKGCAVLTTASALPATTLADRCYKEMFYNCISLKLSETQTDEYTVPYRIPMTGIGTTATDALDGMFSNTGGTFTGTPTINTTYYTDHMPVGSKLTFSSQNGEFTLRIGNSSKNWDGTIEWSTNSTDWAEWDGTTTLNSENGVLYLRGENNSKITGNNPYANFVLGGESTRVACEGNIEALRSYTGTAPDMAAYCYANMFGGCTKLAVAPELPATTLADWCYLYMFQGCTALTTAPALPATTLANDCYNSMFSLCTSLTAAPALPATTLAIDCYMYMFKECTALTTAPALPATTLATCCYACMFWGCTSLTTVPALPATTLAIVCYANMFKGCTSLKLSETQTDEYTVPYRIPMAGAGTTAEGALDDMFSNTGGTFTGTPTINTTYYTTNPPVE